MNKAVSSRNTKRGGRFAWGAAALCSALGLGAVPDLAQAQSICSEAGCPTTFAIAEKPLQKVPTTFKFQSRISQAKIPLGDAKLATVVVNLNRANGQELCSETLSNVMIRDSVLNIDIGRGMSCQMDEVIANNNDLSFQVCIGGSENCLKPVSLGTVPQAIKASFAVQAQEAYKSQIAAQAHFAHRITPEPDLFTTNTISKGYYDFQTPTGATAMTGSLVSNPQTNAGGYIQWTPVNAADNILHVSSGASSGSARTLRDLASFIVHAGSTNVMGTLTTERGVTVKTGGVAVQAGGANVTGGIVVRPTPGVSMTTLDVQGNEVVTGSVTVSNGIGVSGSSTFSGATTFSGSTAFSGNTTIGTAGTTTTFAGTLVGLPTTTSTGIEDGAVTNAKLAGEITNDKLSGGITTSKMAPCNAAEPTTSFCVSSAMIADGAITNQKLAGGITGDKIANGAIGNAQLAGGISGGKLASGSVSSNHIAEGSVGSRELGLTLFGSAWLPATASQQTIISGSGLKREPLLRWNNTTEKRGVCFLSGIHHAFTCNIEYVLDPTCTSPWFCPVIGIDGAATGSRAGASCTWTCI